MGSYHITQHSIYPKEHETYTYTRKDLYMSLQNTMIAKK